MIDGLVSIIMPSWNTAKFICESIQSVIDQTYQNWELLIVDDCSTDNTDEVVKPYLEDKRIKYFKNEQNLGAALTRNYALREAQGEWIAFLDSDDLWMPEKLKIMKWHDYVPSYKEFEKINEDGRPIGVHISGPEIVDKRKMYDVIYHVCWME